MQDLVNSLTKASSASKTEDENKPRPPPPAATPLDFPCCSPQGLKAATKLHAHQDLVKLFSNILRTGPTLEHLEALNVSLVQDVSLDFLLPPEFLPPISWLQDPAKPRDSEAPPTTVSTNETLSNGGPIPGHEAFYTRAKELLHANEDAFRTIQRKNPLPNHAPARVVHFRRFWEGLSMMADFWDTSLDRYSKNRGEPDSSAMDIDDLRSEAQKLDQPNDTANDEAQEEETYTGRRTDTGRNMPGKYREDTVFTFVETIAWVFRCRLEQPKMQPRLNMQGMILPLPHAGNIYRTPADSRLARRGIVEGPVTGVYCRDQSSFRRPEDEQGKGKQEILDLLREVGIMLMLAQKRARQGKEEELPGHGKWWATAPRWGGGKGGETGVPEGEIIVEPPSADAPRKRSRKMNRAELWRSIRPPASTWEKGVTYSQVGKGKHADHDDVSCKLQNPSAELIILTTRRSTCSPLSITTSPSSTFVSTTATLNTSPSPRPRTNTPIHPNRARIIKAGTD